MEELIFTKDELNRIKVKNINGKERIMVDLHGFSVREAKRFLRNLIAVHREPFELDIIHGYVHGTALKEMVRRESFNRVTTVEGKKNNYGMTIMQVA